MTAPVKKRRRWPKRVFFAVVVLAVLFAGYRLTLHYLVKARVNAIRQQGYPVTIAELDKWYQQPPAGENAADLYAMAMTNAVNWSTNLVCINNLTAAPGPQGRGVSVNDDRIFKRAALPFVGVTQLPHRTEPLLPMTTLFGAEYIRDNAVALDYLHRAAAVPSARYPIDLKAWPNIPLPHLSELRDLSRLLQLKIILDAEAGRTQLLLDSVDDCLGLERSLDKDPFLMSQIIRIAMQETLLRSIERALNRATLDEMELERLTKRLSSTAANINLSRSIVSERCCAIACFELPVRDFWRDLMPSDYPPEMRPPAPTLFSSVYGSMVDAWNSAVGDEPEPSLPLLVLDKIDGVMDFDRLRMLAHMEEYLKICQTPVYPATLYASRDIEAKGKSESRGMIMWQVYLQAIDGTIRHDARYTARLRAAIVALAIERARLASSRLPEKLSELVPAYLAEVPVDPFNGQPMHYKKLPKGYVVYSVGEDGVDDGGNEQKDITFTIER